MNYIEVKEYDTLRLSCEYQDEDSVPLSLAEVNIESDMRSIGDKTPIDLVVEMGDVVGGVFILTSPLIHILPRDYKIDIMFRDKVSNNIITSETFIVRVLHSVTIPTGFVYE